MSRGAMHETIEALQQAYDAAILARREATPTSDSRRRIEAAHNLVVDELGVALPHLAFKADLDELRKAKAHAQSAENESANLKSKVAQLEARLREPKESPPWLADLAVALGQVAPDGTPLALNWTQAMAEVRRLRERPICLLDADEKRQLLAQVTDLQRRGTELVTENRALRAEVKIRRSVDALAGDDMRADVVAFFGLAGQEVGSGPHIPSDDVVRLRLRLNAEEVFETIEAGVHPSDCTSKDLLRKARTLVMMAIDSCRVGVDLPGFADGCIDSLYVTIGALVAFGIDIKPLWRAVQAANMAKVGGPKDPVTSKQLKPPGWVPPDIAGELAEQGWRQ